MKFHLLKLIVVSCLVIFSTASFVIAGGESSGGGGDSISFSGIQNMEDRTTAENIADTYNEYTDDGTEASVTSVADGGYNVTISNPEGEGSVDIVQTLDILTCIDGTRRTTATIGSGRAAYESIVYIDCCDDPAANNPGAVGECAYDPVPCSPTNSCGMANTGEEINGVCSVSAPAESLCPVPPQCSDGIDNDGDGIADYPNDPGCSSPDDDDERDVCNDVAADNYGRVGVCAYTCQDSTANNTGRSLPCTFDPTPEPGNPTCGFGSSPSGPWEEGDTYNINSTADNADDSTIRKFVDGVEVNIWEYQGGGLWNPGLQTLTGVTRFRRGVWRHDAEGNAYVGSCEFTMTPQPTTPTPACTVGGQCSRTNSCSRDVNLGTYDSSCNCSAVQPSEDSCNVTSCPSGQVLQNGSCVTPTQTNICSPNIGQVCNQASNVCGETRYALFACDGSCPAVAPPSDASCQCQNGSDDDGDGLVDSGDPGCYNPNDPNEADAPVSITVTPPLVRSGDEVEVSWNLGSNAANNCTVVGPDVGGIDDDSYEPTSATDRTGSATITATSQAVYTATCGTQTDQAQVRLVPIIFET